MNYAFVENGIVTNIVFLSPANADEFPNAVNIDDYPVHIGDTYADGKFYRDGSVVESYMVRTINDAQNALLIEMDEAYREGVNFA